MHEPAHRLYQGCWEARHLKSSRTGGMQNALCPNSPSLTRWRQLLGNSGNMHLCFYCCFYSNAVRQRLLDPKPSANETGRIWCKDCKNTNQHLLCSIAVKASADQTQSIPWTPLGVHPAKNSESYLLSKTGSITCNILQCLPFSIHRVTLHTLNNTASVVLAASGENLWRCLRK